MKMKGFAVMAAALFCLIVTGIASAEEKFGVNIYPGAKYDAATTKIMVDAMSVKGAFYRTNDNNSKVIDFYKQQPGIKLISSDKGGALFRRCKEEYNEFLKKNISVDCDLDVTIQNPWMNMQTGKMMKDTLISIVGH